MTTAPERPRARRSAGDLLRAGAALSVLAALLIGVPWALPALTGPLLPAGVPAGDAVAAALTSPDAGALVRLLPVLAAWAAWAAFTACVAAEIAAQARNRPTPRLPGLRWGQVAAAKLVPAVAVGLGRGAGLADVVPASEAILAATPVEAAATGARTGAPAAAADAGEPADDPGTYTTRRHDTYIGIAQEQLGDRARYSEIIDLNVGREMPDGTVLTGEEFLEPGWPLLLPTDDRDEDDPAEEGDEDGDPDGAEPPAPDGARRTGAGAPAPASPAAAGTGANAAPDRRGNRRRRTEPTGEKTDQAVPAVKVAGYSAPLAVGLLGLLDARRLLQQRRRRPGHRIVQPTDDALVAAEETMRHAADPAGVGLLDQALRSLAARAARTGRPLPPLLGARVTPRDCELLLAAEDEDETGAEPLAPFQAVDGCTWRLDPGDEALLGRGEAAAVPGPCPGLVTLGRDAAGAHLFVDLTRAAAVNLTGAPEHVREVLTALALELAASAWAGRIGVTAVGFGDELPALLRTDRPDRLRHTGTVSACLDRIELLARDLHDGAEQGEERPTEIILSARPIARGDLRRLRDIASAAPDLPLGIVAAAGDDRHLPTDWTLDAAPEAVVTLPGTERTVLLQRMTAEQSDQVAAVLGAAARTRSAPAEGWEAVPPEPDGADADAEEERPHDPADPADPEEERTDPANRLPRSPRSPTPPRPASASSAPSASRASTPASSKPASAGPSSSSPACSSSSPAGPPTRSPGPWAGRAGRGRPPPAPPASAGCARGSAATGTSARTSPTSPAASTPWPTPSAATGPTSSARPLRCRQRRSGRYRGPPPGPRPGSRRAVRRCGPRALRLGRTAQTGDHRRGRRRRPRPRDPPHGPRRVRRRPRGPDRGAGERSGR